MRVVHQAAEGGVRGAKNQQIDLLLKGRIGAKPIMEGNLLLQTSLKDQLENNIGLSQAIPLPL